MAQLHELGKFIADFETQENLKDRYFMVYKDKGTPEYYVNAGFPLNEPGIARISVNMVDIEKSTKSIDFLKMELTCDAEKNITGLHHITVRHYTDAHIFYELEYKTDDKEPYPIATLAKISKHPHSRLGEHEGEQIPLGLESAEVTALNLTSHRLPKQIDWVRTAFMYAT
ncbi:hypothetical protein HZB96_05640 [Candidatus Gottesmanbacteria bacterium]|nr:hypothetical protein [Candidatus Gottesmanbacteria bacterium]